MEPVGRRLFLPFLPQQQQLPSLLIANKKLPKLQTLALHQWTPVQNNPPHFLLEFNKTDCPFASSDLPMVRHSLHVPNCNPSVIPK